MEFNEYFELQDGCEISPSGQVALKKAVSFLNTQSINFTTYLSSCDSTICLAKQLVTVNVIAVNQFAPRLILQVFLRILIYNSIVII